MKSVWIFVLSFALLATSQAESEDIDCSQILEAERSYTATWSPPTVRPHLVHHYQLFSYASTGDFDSDERCFYLKCDNCRSIWGVYQEDGHPCYTTYTPQTCSVLREPEPNERFQKINTPDSSPHYAMEPVPDGVKDLVAVAGVALINGREIYGPLSDCSCARFENNLTPILMPSIPGNISAHITDSQIKFSWESSDESIDNFRVVWKKFEGSQNNTPSMGSLDCEGENSRDVGLDKFYILSHEDIGALEPDTRYRFNVCAQNEYGITNGQDIVWYTPPIRVDYIENYPNPFKSSMGTKIKYNVHKKSYYSIRIYNVKGEIVRELLNDSYQETGKKEIDWDGKDSKGNPVASGIYLYRLTSEERIYANGKMVVTN